MSYSDLAQMKVSQGLRERITACAAQCGVPSPELWVGEHLWKIISDEEWVEEWGEKEKTKNRNVNQDTGARDDTITDAMILTAVEAIIDAQ